MLSKRYTIVVADRTSGVVRRLTLAVGPVLAAVLAVLALPVLMGLGARWSASSEIAQLRARSATLAVENESYRAATSQLAGQISALQTAIEDLSERSNLDPASAKALKQLPALLKSATARGGSATAESPVPVFSSLMISPENTFGVLQDLLGVLESRLSLVRTNVERREALAASTPSIWPAHGWLSDVFGNRVDPFTHKPDYHPALDIDTDAGQPVYATANGVVETAEYSGAYGNLIVVKHGFGFATRYGHLSKFQVRKGDHVTRGQVIGLVGSTGRATGSHLHYEVWAGARPVNPLQLLGGPSGR